VSQQDIFESLRKTPIILKEFLEEIAVDQLSKRLKPDGWTICEQAVHIMDIQPMLSGRLEQFINEERPVIQPFSPDYIQLQTKSAQCDLDAALETFARQRNEFVDRLQAMTLEQLNKKAEHPEYRNYTPRIMARHLLLHDHLHMYRIEEIWLANA
jgi:hypothetical protein